MDGEFQFDQRGEDLATGANTTDVAHAYPLVDRGKGGWITQATIAVGVAGSGAGGAGPVLAVAIIFQRGSPNSASILKPSEWARSPPLGGGTGDVWAWTGRVGYLTGSTLRIYVRNDTGATVFWFAAWGVEVIL